MKSNLTIKQYSYNKNDLNNIKSYQYGTNWPHVYLIHDDNRLYVGETQNIFKRTNQHLSKNDVGVKRNSSVIEIITDSSLNKSAILDIEQQLIQLFTAENKYKMLNHNPGQSCLHNYYQKDFYHTELLENIWDELIKQKLATKPVYLLKNLDIFKYSPFVSLTQEQLDVCESIMLHMVGTLPDKTGTFVVEGSAGTGKTVLSIFLLSLLRDLIKGTSNKENSEDYDGLMSTFNSVKSALAKTLIDNNINKIGFVVPMTSLRNTLKSVFKDVGLSFVKVIGPDAVVNGDFDILFVDEAHRLFHRKNLTSYESFDNKCKMLDLNKDTANQLQWIMLKSKYVVLFYDEAQSVKKSDITKKEFLDGSKMHDMKASAKLTSQLRVKGGGDYLEYIDHIFSSDQDEKLSFSGYDVFLFDDIKDMVNLIHDKDSEFGISRLMAGYGWKWETKGKSHKEINNKGLYDIDINGTHLVWNTTASRWICSNHAIDEVGCIHTTQGFDLNYAGIIFGPEIDYDPKTKRIVVDKDKFYDKKVKAGATDKELYQFIVNAYKVMLKRGIYGTYLYAVNDNLKNYLSQFFDKYKKPLDN